MHTGPKLMYAHLEVLKHILEDSYRSWGHRLTSIYGAHLG